MSFTRMLVRDATAGVGPENEASPGTFLERVLDHQTCATRKFRRLEWRRGELNHLGKNRRSATLTTTYLTTGLRTLPRSSPKLAQFSSLADTAFGTVPRRATVSLGASLHMKLSPVRYKPNGSGSPTFHVPLNCDRFPASRVRARTWRPSAS